MQENINKDNTPPRKTPSSKTRNIYIMRLVGRIFVLVICSLLLILAPDQFKVLEGWNFFKTPSLLHLLWLIWLFDMFLQLIPAKANISIGSKKNFLAYFLPIKEKINKKALKEYIVATTKSAYKVFIIWIALTLVIGALYLSGIISRNIVFIITVIFYVCDLICVLIWCPFRLIMKNKCCTTCRIFNWDHLMMFSPFVFIGGFYPLSLLAISVAVWSIWEFSVFLHPERFWSNSNEALRCDKCTDKLCTQYCQKIRTK